MQTLKLDNGIRILLDEQKHVKTACFGLWIKSGPFYESSRNNGVSHFLEHMVFKGSSRRSGKQIAEEMDEIGGHLNAYTARDYTCFYARTLEEHVAEGFSILCDMVANPLMKEEDIETEKGVILEEVRMNDDQPDDLVSENLYRMVWKNSSYSLPILGVPESIQSINQKEISAYRLKAYAPDRIVICVSGNFPQKEILKISEEYFGKFIVPSVPLPLAVPPTYQRCHIVEYDSCEQSHLLITFPGLSSLSKERQALNLLNIITAGSTSSRLFQHIREKLGLAYSVFSSALCYENAGLFEIQTAVKPSYTRLAYFEIMRQLEKLRDSITDHEFLRAREQLKSSVLMGLEAISSRASFFGRNELLKGEVKSQEELLADINAVTKDQVDALAYRLIDLNSHSLSIVGPVKKEDFPVYPGK